ncbi:hypothetical protein O6H91_02G024700 [Diphasiastrum complanatum]|uniref:Uncharacterized protein n=1 Tax=Diphasiastrum complanatum TaxID=34168 RepID=A0ACC2EE06_DIPCM|nr:hypothetical protein O6H91_02G024700 [Diphasiastrum complanatum]
MLCVLALICCMLCYKSLAGGGACLREDIRRMARKIKHIVAVALLLLVMSVAQDVAQQQSDGADPGDDTSYYDIMPITKIGDVERAVCSSFLKNNLCKRKQLTCPKQCPSRAAHSGPSCFVDCSPKCQATCKHRKLNCRGFGAVCYDPRFVGGDGIAFYFHGKANHDFCIVSDNNLHVNAHFIGKRPPGRSRDYTWIQALGIRYASHNLTIAAKKVSTWDDTTDHLILTHDNTQFTIQQKDLASWTSPTKDATIERLDDVNSVEVIIHRIMKVKVSVVPITVEDSKIHNYQITSDDCFAHLDVQFTFLDLSEAVDGVLGQTYKPNFHTPVKVGVPMPIMGGNDKYQVSSLLSTDCKATKFSPALHGSSTMAARIDQIPQKMQTVDCSGSNRNGGRMLCRR